MRILIADDDSACRVLLAGLLRKQGHVVIEAADGDIAWRILAKDDPPPLVILDWVMPGLDGIEVARKIRSRPLSRPPYIIMLTGRRERSDVLSGFRAGANNYLAKPFDPDDLLERVAIGMRSVAAMEQQLPASGPQRLLAGIRLLEPLGRGASSVVYKGRREADGCLVAVKLLDASAHNGQHDMFQRRFLREIGLAGQITHPNVVAVLTAGHEHDTAYIVMEFVDGNSMGTIIDTNGPCDEDVTLALARELAAGLHAIHEHGLIHRDIKPDNLLVDASGHLKIADLGLARRIEEPDRQRLTATGATVGTPLYMAPETIRDVASAGPAADVYSYGATLYCMLTGHPPFRAKTPYEAMMAHLERPAPPLHTIRPGTGADLASLIDACLNKAPQRRPGLSEIMTCLDDGSSGSRPRSGLLAAVSEATRSLARRLSGNES